jgi:hypothetical protein
MQKVLEDPRSNRSRISNQLAQIEVSIKNTIKKFKIEAGAYLPLIKRLSLKIPRISEMDAALAKIKANAKANQNKIKAFKNNAAKKANEVKANKAANAARAANANKAMLNTIQKLKNRVGNNRPAFSKTTLALNTLSRLKNVPNYNKINNVNVKALLATKTLPNLSGFNSARLNRINAIIKSRATS